MFRAVRSLRAALAYLFQLSAARHGHRNVAIYIISTYIGNVGRNMSARAPPDKGVVKMVKGNRLLGPL